MRYDGPDLAEVAAHWARAQEVVAAHSGVPGGWPSPGSLPGSPTSAAATRGWSSPAGRTPRTSVPAGAVALAAGYSAVYPRASPGGWQLIGQTEAPLWDLARRPPALLRPGQLVRFRPVDP